MSPREQARAWLAVHAPGENLEALCEQHGFPPRVLIDTERVFCLAEAVEGAWLVYLVAGELAAVWAEIPYPLPYVFYRRARNQALHLRVLGRMESLNRKTTWAAST